MTRVHSLRQYFQQQRRKQVRRYKDAVFWVERREARAEALRYSQLIRRMDNEHTA